MNEGYDGTDVTKHLKPNDKRTESYANTLIDANIARALDQSVIFFREHKTDPSLPTQRAALSDRPYFGRRQHKIS